MAFADNQDSPKGPLRQEIAELYRAPENEVLGQLIARAGLAPGDQSAVQEQARGLVAGVRANRRRFGGIDKFLQEYGLTTDEGVALMCLAEALLRIPDAHTADLLIEDKIGGADWERHIGQGEGAFVNASTWALMLTGRVMDLDGGYKITGNFLGRLVKRAGEPVIRAAMRHAMRIMGQQFVMGRTIGEALGRAKEHEAQGYRYSYDMLGEAARTMADAERYFEAYKAAIGEIGKDAKGAGVIGGAGISVKLSALHPRYEVARRRECVPFLTDRLVELCRAAKSVNIGLCVDAEEADRLELSLDIIEAASGHADLGGWEGFGLAVQAYQKRASGVIDWLADLAERHGRRLMVRLVKGAYWDTEIKLAQEGGLVDYPVFTRKVNTDVSYQACARRMLERRDVFYPQFATHNAQTVAYVLRVAGNREGYEFQRLHGMGEPLYDQLVGPDLPVRVYAPVGGHEELLAYLVRRLLENGANTSFVNRLQDDAVPIDDIVADPVAEAGGHTDARHPKILLPAYLYQPARINSKGLDLHDPTSFGPVMSEMDGFADWHATALIDGEPIGGQPRPIVSPYDHRQTVGSVRDASATDVEQAMASASRAFPDWDGAGGAARADILDRMADALEANRAELMALACREAGKTLPDAVSEVREAIDFCRYYAERARSEFAEPLVLPGPTGEANSLALRGRGVFLCISPWNFPLAIFTGQIAAALVAGNCVIAKPAEQTPLIAWRAVSLFHQAGVPGSVLQLLPGDGPTLGAPLLAHPALTGVAFTGSTDTARLINRSLAERTGPILPLIAETGGQNAMIVDSSALPEQVVLDVIASAFQSAGQRCSALRVLFVQDSVADTLLTMLRGASETLTVGDPTKLETDIGPVIDAEAKADLDAHAKAIRSTGRSVVRVALGPSCDHGTFVAPEAFEIDRIDRLTKENFGPLLHVVRYAGDRLDAVIDAIAATGYGLTLGVHSRVQRTIDHIHERLPVGNTYVNRNIIGAVVGVQPFGGQNLSGTGPKAGGPHYLPRFATERTLSVNTTAAGGNASLISLEEDD
ncbi:MAG: bifunctional proline dehydrogenase/L-glutamate gamma-semialdehyde dehydrogenase PutA [Pseudomonadota bacterium]